ncbi:hypothetical protein BOTNAR_1807g00010 [Botryotinia narcissicola]|uniref:Uncharacterized protein n=1 Tax=Botryotinia narcissicola TaxID=278944 RepID=A0A4Z1H303_9HELO|nr:hypothetical protein BOTNAR_1807g00010 [Botryotinia narcissicola]
MPGRTYEYLTSEQIFQGYTKDGGPILRYRHKNYVFNGRIGKEKFVEAANVAFDHADYVKTLRQGKDTVYERAAHFIIARIGLHITTSYNTEDGHVNKMADKSMHLTITAISTDQLRRDPEKMFGATGHLPSKNYPFKDDKGRTIDNYIYNPSHKDADGEPKPWSWYNAKQLGNMNRDALVASIDNLKTSRTPSPEQKAAAPAPAKPAPIPSTSAWGSGKGKSVDPGVGQITKTLAESSIQGAEREAKQAGGNSERGRTVSTQGSGKPRSRSSSQKPKPTETRYDSDGKHNSHDLPQIEEG